MPNSYFIHVKNVMIYVMNKNMIYTIVVVLAVVILWSLWGFFGSRVEQTNYTVVKKMNGYEIREYPSHIVAQTIVDGTHNESMNKGFSIVAGYIFGGNTKRESIAMTAPVVVQNMDNEEVSERIPMTAPVVSMVDGNSHAISFSMPSSYTLETLPIPNDPRVKIILVPAKKYAAMRFSWYRSDAKFNNVKEKLLLALSRDEVSNTGNASYAGYNAPWTPPWMIRNEVLIELY